MSEDCKHMDSVMTKRELMNVIDKYNITIADHFKEKHYCSTLMNRVGQEYKTLKYFNQRLNETIDSNATISKVYTINGKSDEYKALEVENILLKNKLERLENFKKTEDEYKARIKALTKIYKTEISNLIDERQDLLAKAAFYKEEYKNTYKKLKDISGS